MYFFLFIYLLYYHYYHSINYVLHEMLQAVVMKLQSSLQSKDYVYARYGRQAIAAGKLYLADFNI